MSQRKGNIVQRGGSHYLLVPKSFMGADKNSGAVPVIIHNQDGILTIHKEGIRDELRTLDDARADIEALAAYYEKQSKEYRMKGQSIEDMRYHHMALVATKVLEKLAGVEMIA